MTYRPDMALALVLVYGWYLWRNPRWRTVVVAAVVGLLPMWVHVALVGPSTAFRGMVIDPVFKLRAGASVATATVVEPPRRIAAGHRRTRSTVVEGARICPPTSRCSSGSSPC